MQQKSPGAIFDVVSSMAESRLQELLPAKTAGNDGRHRGSDGWMSGRRGWPPERRRGIVPETLAEAGQAGIRVAIMCST
jgi:hypothetical protein